MTDLLLLKKLTKGSCIVCNIVWNIWEKQKNFLRKMCTKKVSIRNRCYLIWLILLTGFSGVLKLGDLLQGSWNVLHMNSWIHHHHHQTFQTVECRLKKYPDFWTMTLKPIMQNGNSYIRDSGHFIERIRNINNLPENTRLVTTDIVHLYPSIPPSSRFECTQRNSLEQIIEKDPKNGRICLEK